MENGLLERFMENGLKLKPSKCNFFHTEINYLGHKVSVAGMEPGTEDLKGITEIAPPATYTQVRKFLGTTGYFRVSSKDTPRLPSHWTTCSRGRTVIAHFCSYNGFWDLISIPKPPKSGWYPQSLMYCVRCASIRKGYPVIWVLLIVLWRPCTWAGMTEGRRMWSPSLPYGVSVRTWDWHFATSLVCITKTQCL